MIGLWCGVRWGANTSAVTWLSMIGGNVGCEIKGSAGVSGFGKKMRQSPLLGREVIKINPSPG
jgi:hypothetical protein